MLATTQMEATDARRAFPCWDEPDAKAVFGVTLVVPDDLLAISNAGEVGREPAGDGKVAVRFADTMPMSTYLVAFVVGPLVATGPVDVDGKPLRVVHPPGKEHLAAFALEVGSFALRYFTDWFGMVYRATSSTWSPSPTSRSGPWRTWAASPSASATCSSTRPSPPRPSCRRWWT